MILNGIDDDEKWLAEGIAGIQHHAFYLHRALVHPLRLDSISQFFPRVENSNSYFSFSQDANNLREALKHSAQMLSELRTSKLSPHKYYELCIYFLIAEFDWSYVLDIEPIPFRDPIFRLQLGHFVRADMRAFDELRKLEMYFKDESKHGVSIVDLYELVQHAGNVLPRLWVIALNILTKSIGWAILVFEVMPN